MGTLYTVCRMRTLFLLLSFITTITASVPAYALSDVAGYPWAESIRYLEEQGIVSGYPDGSFQPKRTLNRAELTKIVIEATFDDSEFATAADDCFPDVRRTDWFAKYVCFAKEQGIVKGYGDGTFRPGAEIIQPEALKIVLESFYEGIPTSPGQWYQTYFDEAEYSGMLYFAQDRQPELHKLTRGEMAYFVAWNLDEEGELEDQIEGDWQLSDAEVGEVEDDFDWEPMTAQDCEEGERFDAEEELCYLPEDEEWDDESWDDDEEDLADYYDEEYEPVRHDEEGADEDTKYVYSIAGSAIKLVRSDGDVSALPAVARDTAQHQQVWQRVTELIPESYRGNLQYFYIFSDGAEGTMAYVEPLVDGKWALGIDALDAKNDPRELTLTIIHEYGHTLTLGVDQIEDLSRLSYAEAEQRCKPRYFTGDGCAKPDSFIEKFYRSFWTGRVTKQYRRGFAQESGDTAAVPLYEDDPSRYVTEYAASSVEEDIAESFAYFVFHDRPTGTAIKDDKLRFFEQFPSLMKLRKEMREGIVQ